MKRVLLFLVRGFKNLPILPFRPNDPPFAPRPRMREKEGDWVLKMKVYTPERFSLAADLFYEVLSKLWKGILALLIVEGTFSVFGYGTGLFGHLPFSRTAAYSFMAITCLVFQLDRYHGYVTGRWLFGRRLHVRIGDESIRIETFRFFSRAIKRDQLLSFGLRKVESPHNPAAQGGAVIDVMTAAAPIDTLAVLTCPETARMIVTNLNMALSLTGSLAQDKFDFDPLRS